MAQEPEERPPAKPTLLVMPGGLIEQWIEQVQACAPQLKIYKYHGDPKAKPTGDWENIAKLHHDHPICHPLRHDTARSLIFTTPGTLGVRHGPRALSAHLRKQGMAKNKAKDVMYTYQPFPDDLRDVFGTVIFDEAHLLKSTDTEANISMQWLNASFYLFLTATPMSAGALDFAGYLKILEKPNLNLWTPGNFAQWGIEDWMNPYRLEDDHPAVVLRLTMKAAREFIFKSSIAPALQGQYVRQIWKTCLLRRTYTSQMPFGSGRTIGSAMPRVHASIIGCEFLPEENTFYQNQVEGLIPKLVTKHRKSDRLLWSFGVLRKITLLCMWGGFAYLEEVVKASSIKAWLQKDDYIHEWLSIVQANSGNPPPPPASNQPEVLKLLIHGAPKLRALLYLIADVVVRDQQKMIVFCAYPATELLIYGALQLMQVSCILYSSSMKAEELGRAVQRFNNTTYTNMVFITSYAKGGYGMNLQNKCWNVVLAEPAG